MEIMRRSTLVLALLPTMMSSAVAQGRRPKITTYVLCGIVTDLAGAAIEKATVAAMWADFGTSTETDKSGRWSFGAGAGPHWMKVDANGYETIIFDYVDKPDPTSTGAEKPAFMRPEKDGGCPTPIYVRLAPTNSNAGFVSLDAVTRMRKREQR